MEYRRDRTKGGTWFFTVVTHERRPVLGSAAAVAALRAAVAGVRRCRPFAIEAWVILPDHMHAIWTLPEGDHDFSARWRHLKAEFSRSIDPADDPLLTRSRAQKRERMVWQRRFWEHRIRDETDFARHVDYVHVNPVKHGLVPRVQDWPHSTFHHHVRIGTYPASWAADPTIEVP